MHPRNMTDAEILTEAEARHAADPLIAALVKMAAGETENREELERYISIAEDHGAFDADELQTMLQQADSIAGTLADFNLPESSDDLHVTLSRIDRAALRADDCASFHDLSNLLDDLAVFRDLAASHFNTIEPHKVRDALDSE